MRIDRISAQMPVAAAGRLAQHGRDFHYQQAIGATKPGSSLRSPLEYGELMLESERLRLEFESDRTSVGASLAADLSSFLPSANPALGP